MVCSVRPDSRGELEEKTIGVECTVHASHRSENVVFSYRQSR